MQTHFTKDYNKAPINATTLDKEITTKLDLDDKFLQNNQETTLHNILTSQIVANIVKYCEMCQQKNQP